MGTPSHKQEGKTSDDSPVFYGVRLLDGRELAVYDDGALVFCDKKEALQTVKKHSGARFKVFSTREDAANFSKSSLSTPRLTDGSFQDSPVIHRSVVGEKPSAFKAPRSQDMVKLRKAIECGDVEYFKQTVWLNPRYLVSCGDTPAILQEGFRYNALHVAAKHNQGSICSLVVSTLEDSAFLLTMYSDDSPQVTQQRREYIIDLYLNMPEKGLCETPLHFACKFGCVKVAEVLLRHPACNTACKNKYDKTPQEIICERNGNSEVRKQIEALFEAMYYVPVWRSEDNSVQGILGHPYRLSYPQDPLRDMMQSPVHPSLTIKAKAGPMSFKQAESFYKRWHTSSSSASEIKQNPSKDVRLTDSRKGLERIGRLMAREKSIPWTEHWSFLDNWTDLSSSDGLQHLETHLRNLYHKAISKKNLSESEQSNEELDSSNALSPMSRLCRQLEEFHLNTSLNTSPDTPALFGNRSFSESSCSSPDQHQSAFASPCLRSRTETPNSYIGKNDSNIGCNLTAFVTSTPAAVRNNNEDSEEIIKDWQKIGIVNYEPIVSTLVAYLSGSDNEKSCLEFFLHSFKKFLNIANRFNLKSLSRFHSELAEEVVRQLEDLLQKSEASAAINKLKFLLYHNRNSDDSSSDEETNKRRDHYTQIKFSKRDLIKEHVGCVLNNIETLLGSYITSEQNCFCSWKPLEFMRTGSLETLSCLLNNEGSSEDEFHTPPSSYSGSPLSSVDEDVFTPDEGLRIFVMGLTLSKADLDVRNALEGLFVDPVLYPHINMWRQALDSCTKEDINRLRTPVPSRRHSVGGYEQFQPSSPYLAPSRSQALFSTPVTTVVKNDGWKTAPNQTFNPKIKPKNFYNSFVSWDEGGD